MANKLPKLSFPKFDGGMSPRMWQTLSEEYFEMFGLDPALWVRVSALYFEGPAVVAID